MNTRKLIVWTWAVALLVTGFVGSARALSSKHHDADPKQVSALLLGAKRMAVQAKEDAETMQSFSQMGMRWEAHAEAIAEIKGHVVAMRQQAIELKAAQGTAEPWQRNVIGRIEPYLAEMAKDNGAVIDEMNAHPSLFGTPAWNAYLEANADSATYLAGLIVNFVDNGAMRQKMQDYDQPLDTCGLSGVINRPYGQQE